jgi:hypothetical protein
MTQLPAAISQDAMVEVAVQWIDRVSEKLKTEYAHGVLRDYIREQLQQGTLSTKAVIDAARRGNPHADFALRWRIHEMLEYNEELPTSLKAYIQDALFTGPLSDISTNVADLYYPDAAIAIMVKMAIVFWHLNPTRNRASKRPSASTVVARALIRRGINVTEWQVEHIHRNHHKLAARLSATIPTD